MILIVRCGRSHVLSPFFCFSFCQLLSSLSSQHRATAFQIGIDPDRVLLWRHSPPSQVTRASLLYKTHKRFFFTLILNEYLQWEEMETNTRVAEGIDKSDTLRGHSASSACV